MINKVVGDTIIFEAILTDADGTAITGAVANLSIVDGVGSTVYSSTAPHIATGTYQRSIETVGWGNGQIVQTWRFTSSGGTSTEVLANTYRIVGTDPNLTYISAPELKFYFDNVEDYFDGSEDEKVLNAYNFVNNQLTSLGHQVPVQCGTDGVYDQGLRDWNAWEALFRIVAARAVSQLNENNDKPWYYKFKDLSDEKWKQFKDKKIVLNRQTGPGKVGISAGTKIAGTLFGQMFTNWEGYGRGFLGEDFPRTWKVEVIGTGTSGGLFECPYRVSNDDGLTWLGTFTTAQDWTYIKDEVYLRFTKGTSTGSTNLFGTTEAWQFTTAPLKISTGGKNIAKSY